MKQILIIVLLISTIIGGSIVLTNANLNNFSDKNGIVYYKHHEFVTGNALDIRVLWLMVDDNAETLIIILACLGATLLLYGFLVVLPSPVGERKIKRE